MSYHIIEKPAFHIVGIRMNLVDDMEENQKNVPLFWEQALNDRRFSELCELNNAAPNGILGISVYENPENIFYYIATSSTNKAPDGICEYEIPASTWVVFENDGYFKENVQSVFRRLYTEWLPFSGYEYAGLPDIEVYPIQNKTVQSGHSEVWIAIRKEKENENGVSNSDQRNRACARGLHQIQRVCPGSKQSVSKCIQIYSRAIKRSAVLLLFVNEPGDQNGRYGTLCADGSHSCGKWN